MNRIASTSSRLCSLVQTSAFTLKKNRVNLKDVEIITHDNFLIYGNSLSDKIEEDNLESP